MLSAATRPETWFLDTEWGFHSGRVDEESAWEPVVLCAVGQRSGQRHFFWGRDPRLHRFFADHVDDVFVAHNVVAEMKYLLRLGIAIPQHWFDTFVAFRFFHNAPGHLEARLSHALHQLGLPHLAPAAKKELQLMILHLNFDQEDPLKRQAVVDYCFSDCDGCLNLFQRLDIPGVSDQMPHWVEYLKAVAKMELRGVPFDVATYQTVLDKRTQIRDALTSEINRTWPVFPDGKFAAAAFLAWCSTVNIHWPSKRSSGKKKSLYHPMDKKTFKEMEGRHPFIAEVREVQKTLLNLGQRRSLTVDAQLGRHYFSTNAFRTISSRNQPKNFIFSGPKWLRYLMVPESPDHVLVYVDYVAQEIGLAAALSGDTNMWLTYESPDCHMSFAILAGAAPKGATKQTHRQIRNAYKQVNLGVQYGQSQHGIASKLGISKRAAEALIEDHRRLYPTFWRWSEDLVQGSFDRGWISTPSGWRCRVPRGSNERTWMNWPMQSTGADIMRLTVAYLDQQNVQILALIHDGFLLSCRRSQLEDLRGAFKVAAEAANDDVIPGFLLRWEFTVYDNQFEDEDGLLLWQKLQSVLGGISG